MQIILYFLLIFSYMYLKISRDAFFIMKQDTYLISMKLISLLTIYCISNIFNFNLKSNRIVFFGLNIIICILILLLPNTYYLPNILHYLLVEMISIIINICFWSVVKNRNVLYGSAIATTIVSLLQYFRYFNYYIPILSLILSCIILVFQPVVIKDEKSNLSFKYNHIYLLAFFVNMFTGIIDLLGKDVIKSFSSSSIEFNRYVAIFWFFESICSLLLLTFAPIFNAIIILPISQFLVFIESIFTGYILGHALINKVIKHNIFNVIKRNKAKNISDLKYISIFAKYGKISGAVVILFAMFLYQLLCFYNICFISKKIIIYIFLMLIAFINLFLGYKIK